MNALLASTLTLAASALFSSETSCNLSASIVGEGRREVVGVDRVGEDGTDEDVSLIENTGLCSNPYVRVVWLRGRRKQEV